MLHFFPTQAVRQGAVAADPVQESRRPVCSAQEQKTNAIRGYLPGQVISLFAAIEVTAKDYIMYKNSTMCKADAAGVDSSTVESLPCR